MYMISLIFIIMAIAAAMFDLLTMTIPNWLCALLAVLFFPAALVVHQSSGVVLSQVACGLTVLAAGFILFQCGRLGGGDAKLAAAIALWLGWSGLPAFLLQTALWGGALAAMLLFFRTLNLPLTSVNQKFIARLLDPAMGAPYGVALAIGGVLSLPHSALWRLAGSI